MPLLILFIFAGVLGSSSFMNGLAGTPDISSLPTATPSPVKSKVSGRYCLTQEEFDKIIARPIAFTCNRTETKGCDPADPDCEWEVIEENVPYALAEENVLVSQTFRHKEKQMILKETCHDINYYTWKCHPHNNWGSIYNNTLWKLRDPDPNRQIKDGDYFDVYLRKDLTELPKRWRCPDAVAAAMIAATLAESPLEDKMIHIGTQSAHWQERYQVNNHEIEIVPPREKIAEITLEDQEYDVFVNLLIESSPDRDVYLYLVEKGILPETDEGLPEKIIYDRFLILYETDTKGKTLKLATFDPRPPPRQERGWWDVYIPESKPVVYLYPEKPTRLNFKINIKDGYVTVSDPPYDPETGWNITAYPNGTLKHLEGSKIKKTDSPGVGFDSSGVDASEFTYPYLYYETMVKGYDIPKEGWVIEKQDLTSFFNEILPQLGLNRQEADDFTEYWLPRLENEISTDYIFTTFIPESQINKIDSFEISSLSSSRTSNGSAELTAEALEPRTSIRVRAYFKPLQEWQKITPPTLPSSPCRKGFTVIEWGGILDQN